MWELWARGRDRLYFFLPAREAQDFSWSSFHGLVSQREGDNCTRGRGDEIQSEVNGAVSHSLCLVLDGYLSLTFTPTQDPLLSFLWHGGREPLANVPEKELCRSPPQIPSQ